MPALAEPKPRALASAFLVACSLIVFQVSFTRLIGYKLFYHFVFLAISLSLLGLGAAGTYVAIARRATDEDASLHRWLACLALSVPIAFLLIANPLLVAHHPPIKTKLLGGDAIAYLLWCAPIMVWLNFCGGVVLTSLFTRYSHRMGRLYAADLLGAGAGSLLCVGLMIVGSPPLAFVSATVLIVAAMFPYHRALPPGCGARRGGALAVTVALVLAAAVFAGPPQLRNFENFRTVGGQQRKVTKYRWNHLIRTDHVGNWYVLDGDAATRIVAWSEAERRRPVTGPAYDIAPPNPDVAIIGVGGGRQLAEARRAGASSIKAIDINPTILGWVVGEDRALTRDLFIDGSIELEVAEGRHAIRSAGRSFDVIIMHAIDTYAATASGAYSLTENFLYTSEAFEDYFNALTDEGVLSVSRWLFNPPRENLRLFATAVAALEDLGVESPGRHLAMLAPIRSYEKLGGRRVWGNLLLSRQPLTAARIARLRARVRAQGWTVLYAPDRPSGTPFDEMIDGDRRAALQDDYPYLVSAVTDSSPYLFQFYNPLHPTAYSAEGDWGTVHVYQWSSIILLVTLAMSLVMSLLVIIGPLVVWRVLGGAASREHRFRPLHGLYFAGLGVGFMAFEVPLIQALSLYLGHPTYGFAVVLVALLVATGVGSLAVDRTDVDPSTVCAVIAALLGVVSVTTFPLIHATIDGSDPMRFATALGLVVVCGLPMGMPLALGVRLLGRGDERNVAWAWGVNGAASVVGACLVQIVMVFAGSVTALAGAVACYAVAALAARVWLTAASNADAAVPGELRPGGAAV